MTKGESLLSFPNPARVYEKKHTARACAVVPFVCLTGTIIGLAIGGSFAKLAGSLPSVFFLNGIFAIFQLLLPNFICAALLIMSITAGYLSLMETHPYLRSESTQADLDNSTAETPLLGTSEAIAATGVDLRADSYGTFNDVAIN